MFRLTPIVSVVTFVASAFMASDAFARAALPAERQPPSVAAPARPAPEEPPPSEEGDFLMRVNGVARVPSGERVTTVLVFSGNAFVDGEVTESLVVVNGDAVVAGRVHGDTTVVNGTLRVLSGARVEHASLVDSRLVVAPGADVGVIEQSSAADWRWSFRWMSFFAWVAVTLLVLAAGLLFAAVGFRPLKRAIEAMVDKPGATAIGVLVALLALPLLSVPLLMSGIGTPIGLGIVLFLLPALAVLGYLVSGTAIGAALLRWLRRRPLEGKPYLAATIGLLLLQVIGLIPVLGGIVAFLASLIGAGALLVLAWRALRETAGEPHPVPSGEG